MKMSCYSLVWKKLNYNQGKTKCNGVL